MIGYEIIGWTLFLYTSNPNGDVWTFVRYYKGLEKGLTDCIRDGKGFKYKNKILDSTYISESYGGFTCIPSWGKKEQ